MTTSPAARPAPAPRPLTRKEEAFCAAYLITLNAAESARRGGYSARTAKEKGYQLLHAPAIAARIDVLMAERAQRNASMADAVIARFWAIATADPNEIVEHRVGACRYCHGINHQYQRTPAERTDAYRSWAKTKPETAERTAHAHSTVTGEFDEQGGADYDRRRAPHPDCPECFGVGEGYIVAHDTRYLSEGALMLYAGVRETKEGLDLKVHSQPDAQVSVARHLKLFTDRVEHDVTDGLADALAAARARAKNR